ncbi:MAG: hypothetical protein M3552_16335 [Planctomycetota bacterium]|nr:hypothetical protein [Planctomycetaceae bacterium]MDQ3332194.1 hypothetical protein [Planctomycetota bacterium]
MTFPLRTVLPFFVMIGTAGCDRNPAVAPSPPAMSQPATSQPARSPSVETVTQVDPSRPTPQPVVQKSPEPKVAEPVHRPDDDRPRHDDAALERAGIRKFESRRLVLYTDIDEARAVRLPSLVDALYDELSRYFGELPPARDGSEWQITGYVMRDTDRFTSAGLVPSNLPSFNHGLNRRRRFWMREQSLDYYLAHLLLHEATHCFMTTLPAANGPTWYMEGMAEHFAAHRMTADGALQFRILPKTPDETAGFDRVSLIRKEVDARRATSLDEVFDMRDAEFAESIPYAWSWAACHFLDAHSEYRERFHELGDPAMRSRFRREFDARFANDGPRLRVQWDHFIHTSCYGYDFERALLTLKPGQRVPDDDTHVTVAADRGWQSTGLRLEAGQRYELIATGRFSLCDVPKPWLSEAGGITIDYANGRPIGRLLAAVVADDLQAPQAYETLLDPIDVGGKGTLVAPTSGTLYLRLNDGWDRLADNQGGVTVAVRPIGD